MLKLILLIALPAGLLGKSWHYNPYHNSLKELCEIARDDAKENSPHAVFLDLAGNKSRTGYFSQLHSDYWQVQMVRDTCGQEQLQHLHRALSRMTDSDLVIYFLTKELTLDTSVQLSDVFHDLPGELLKLGERFVNRKRKAEWVLYRYNFNPSAKPLLRAIVPPYPVSPINNVLQNNDFEKTEPLARQAEARKRYINHGLNFFARPDEQIPQNVSISHVPGYWQGSDAEVEADGTNSIAGKYSLRLKSNSIIFAGFAQDIAPGNYRFTALVKGMRLSSLDIYVIPCIPQATSMRRVASCMIPAGKTIWCYDISIPRSALGKCSHFRLMMALNYGEVLIDNVVLCQENILQK